MWRLIIASFLLLLSLLTVFRAPTNFLWKVAIAITEFPYLPLAASLSFLIFSFWTREYKWPVQLLTGISILLFSSPVIRAYKRASGLNEALSSVFPYAAAKQALRQPYSFMAMFGGEKAADVEPQALIYKQLPGKALSLDFYPSQKGAKAPCILVVHGGSWSSGDNKQLPELNSFLAREGYHVAAINYRLAPAYRFPAPVEDLKAALDFLCSESGRLQIDTSNFVLLGRSAGGQIALVAAYSLNNRNIKGVISVYSPADMVWGARIKGNPLVLNTDKVFRDYLGGTIDEVPGMYKKSSACDYVNPGSPPTLIIHGAIDAMVSFEHSVHLSDTLKKNGVKHYFLDLPWATHGCDYNINGPSGQMSTFAIERFINSVTTP